MNTGVNYSTSFLRAVTHVLIMEGGYGNDPKDPGGETKFGISKRAYPNVDIGALTREEAIEIYYRDYWSAVYGDSFDSGVALVLFDCAVNMGVQATIKLAQLVSGAVVDGVFGPDSRHRIENIAPYKFIQWFTMRRIKRYAGMANFTIYGDGWLNRALDTFRESQR